MQGEIGFTERDFVTYGLSCATDSHAANDRTSQDKNGTNAVQQDDTQQTALDDPDIVTVVNFKLKSTIEY